MDSDYCNVYKKKVLLPKQQDFAMKIFTLTINSPEYLLIML